MSDRGRNLSRDVSIVWFGVVLSFVGWVASEYGGSIQRTSEGSIATTGSLLVVAGLIIVAAGFAYVARSARRLADVSPQAAPVQTGSATPDR